MYLIALCDDDEADLDKTEQMLRAYENSHPETAFVLERFLRADHLLRRIREEEYAPDFILMDIYMPKKLGIEAACELRAMGNRGRIIFLTTSREHALEAFGVEASQYLVKPVSSEQLFRVLDTFLAEEEEARRKYLLLRIEGRIQRIPVNELVYCEAQGKSQYLHLSDGTQYNLRRTMAEIYEMLACYREFVRVGVAYILNLDHIESLSTQEVQMDNGKKVFLPRGSYHPLRERYFDYYCESNEVL